MPAAVTLDSVIAKYEAREDRAKILIVGQTGAGKTTLLNYLASFADTAPLAAKNMTSQHIDDMLKGCKSDAGNEGAHAADSGHSQTVDCRTYEIEIKPKSGKPITLIVLDTPGFADTSGVEVDQAHERNIVKCVEDQGYLTCIFFVISGAVTRVHPSIRYTMAIVTSLMPRDILQNVVVVHTFVSDKAKCKFPEKEFVESFAVEPRRYFVENPLAFIQGFEKEGVKQGLGPGESMRAVDKIDWSQDEDDDAEGEQGRSICRSLKKAGKVMTEVLDQIASFPSYKTITIAELKGYKDGITDGLLELSWAVKSEFETQQKFMEADRKRQAKEAAADVYHEKWILVPSKTFNYYCEHVGCAVRGAPCCFQMEAGVGAYEAQWKSNVKKLFTFGYHQSDLDIDKKKAAESGKAGGAAMEFKCDCRHPVQEHIGGHKEWYFERTLEMYAKDAAKDDIEWAKQMEQAHSKSEAKMNEIRAAVSVSLEGYARLGLPKAMKTLLVAQKNYYKELIDTKTGDAKQLQGMIDDVELMMEQIEQELRGLSGDAGPAPAPAGA